jgi:glycine betaine/proline transport system substrate-binding protein
MHSHHPPKFVKKLNKIFIFIAVALGLVLGATSASASCGRVTIAEMNWASAEFMANLDKIILEEGYGCKVELIAGATMTSFASMDEKGEPDIAPELWANAVREPLYKAQGEGRLFVVNKTPIVGAGEGWWIPKYISEKHPELKTLQDIMKRPDLFPHPEDPSKGALHTCPSGWGCQLSTNNLFRAFKMEEAGWRLVDTGSAAGLDGSIAKAYERKEAWLGYYWAPTVVLGKYPMTPVDFGVPYNDQNWNSCIVKSEDECQNPQPSSWTKSEVNTVVTANFKNSSSDAMQYIQARKIPLDQLGDILKWMDANQATGEDAAYEFLSRYGSLWNSWISSDAAAKVKRKL